MYISIIPNVRQTCIYIYMYIYIYTHINTFVISVPLICVWKNNVYEKQHEPYEHLVKMHKQFKKHQIPKNEHIKTQTQCRHYMSQTNVTQVSFMLCFVCNEVVCYCCGKCWHIFKCLLYGSLFHGIFKKTHKTQHFSTKNLHSSRNISFISC